MGENLVDDTLTEDTVERTIVWARAMTEWLSRYESHIEELCATKKLPKPPQW